MTQSTPNQQLSKEDTERIIERMRQRSLKQYAEWQIYSNSDIRVLIEEISRLRQLLCPDV